MKKLTIEFIKSMSDEQWEKYREKEWAKKVKMYSKPAPKNYLKNQDEMIKFLKKMDQNGIKISLKKVDAFKSNDPAFWEDYRQDLWKKKGSVYKGTVPPTWFLQKNSTISFLEKKGL